MFDNLPPHLHEKAQKLAAILKSYPSPFVIACSGGLDSRFLAFFAKKISCRFNLVHLDGSHTDSTETAYLRQWCKEQGLALTVLPVSVFDIPEIANNHKTRCYHCKRISFQTILNNCGNAVVCDGSHADDKNAFRPGLKALSELNIQSPLSLAEISKKDIRELGKLLGLDNYGQKARPCLLTRFPYQTEINRGILEKIQEAEQLCSGYFLKNMPENSPDFRIRYIDNTFHFHFTDAISEENLTALQNLLNSAKIENIKFQRLKTLSGYFDQ